MLAKGWVQMQTAQAQVAHSGADSLDGANTVAMPLDMYL